MMGNYFGNMMGGWGSSFGFFGAFFGFIFTILFWGLIIWAIFSLVRGFSGRGCCGGHGAEHKHREDEALEILKERYAKGEISKEEFERIKGDLQ